jgi:glycosyltransferase involved in cell wall biosynthesis
MKILQIAPVWETVPPAGYGGTEAVVALLVDELVRLGHEVTLWASGDSQTRAELRSVVPISLRQADQTSSALQYSLVHVAKALGEADSYDIVHNHNGPPSELAMAMSLCRPEIPMLTTLHCQLTEDTRFIWENYGGWYNTISHRQAALLPDLPRANFAGVVHNSIDVESFPFEEEKDDYLLFLGRMSDEKAPHLTVEVARELGMKLIIAGQMKMPWEQTYFERKLAPLIDGEQVIFLGEADASTKRKLYAKARCLLVPLNWEEPFGLVMVEAMACGTPVIAFNRGAAPEIVIPGENGFLVEDVPGMIDATRRVGEISPAACRASVEDRFGIAALASGYVGLYEKILMSSVRPAAPNSNGRYREDVFATAELGE